MKTAVLLVAGFLIAFVGQFLAFLIAGAGHGWITPFWASLILWIAYPVALTRMGRADSSVGIDLAILVAALASDAFLIVQTSRESVEYFWNVIRSGGWPIVGLWVTIWLGWQVVALANAARLAQRRA